MVVVEPMREGDWEAVARIYAEGIATGVATFETDVPERDVWLTSRLAWSRLVARDETGAVLGWIAATPKSSRACYAGVIEHSVYVAEEARGQGIGRALLEAFVEVSRANGAWTIETTVFPENAASVALHEWAGFRLVGRRERIAQLDGAWRDTLLLELRL